MADDQGPDTRELGDEAVGEAPPDPRRRPLQRLLWAWQPGRPRRLTRGFYWVAAGFLGLSVLGALPVLFRVGGPGLRETATVGLVTALPAAAMLAGALVSDARAIGHTGGRVPRLTYLAAPSLLVWWLGLALTVALPPTSGRLAAAVLLCYPVVVVWFHRTRRVA